jgi:hypothetical protein
MEQNQADAWQRLLKEFARGTKSVLCRWGEIRINSQQNALAHSYFSRLTSSGITIIFATQVYTVEFLRISVLHW